MVGAATDRLDASPSEETSSAAQAEAASSTPEPSTSSEDKSKVTFDELGGKYSCILPLNPQKDESSFPVC